MYTEFFTHRKVVAILFLIKNIAYIHRRKMEIQGLHHIQKLNKNWILYLNAKTRNCSTCAGKKKNIIMTSSQAKISQGKIQKAQTTKDQKNDEVDIIKIQNFCPSKDHKENRIKEIQSTQIWRGKKQDLLTFLNIKSQKINTICVLLLLKTVQYNGISQ